MESSPAPPPHYAGDRRIASISLGLTGAAVLLLVAAMVVDFATEGVAVRSPAVLHTIRGLTLLVHGCLGAALALAIIERRSRRGQWAVASSLFLALLLIVAFVYGWIVANQRYAQRLRGRVGASSTMPAR